MFMRVGRGRFLEGFLMSAFLPLKRFAQAIPTRVIGCARVNPQVRVKEEACDGVDALAFNSDSRRCQQEFVEMSKMLEDPTVLVNLATIRGG
jgi:hypothetical protein